MSSSKERFAGCSQSVSNLVKARGKSKHRISYSSWHLSGACKNKRTVTCQANNLGCL